MQSLQQPHQQLTLPKIKRPHPWQLFLFAVGFAFGLIVALSQLT